MNLGNDLRRLRFEHGNISQEALADQRDKAIEYCRQASRHAVSLYAEENTDRKKKNNRKNRHE